MTQTSSLSIAERAKRLGGETVKVEKVRKSRYVKKGGNGGARPGGGRKPKESTLIERGIQHWVDQHINEEVDVEIQDPKTGKKRLIKRPRVAMVLQALYEAGMRRDPETGQWAGSVDAAKAWLDRALGKPVQVIAGDQNKPITLRLDF
jgi:hypothetical protein